MYCVFITDVESGAKPRSVQRQKLVEACYVLHSTRYYLTCLFKFAMWWLVVFVVLCAGTKTKQIELPSSSEWCLRLCTGMLLLNRTSSVWWHDCDAACCLSTRLFTTKSSSQMQLLCCFHISASVQIKKQDMCWKAFYRAKTAFSSLDAKQVLFYITGRDMQSILIFSSNSQKFV